MAPAGVSGLWPMPPAHSPTADVCTGSAARPGGLRPRPCLPSQQRRACVRCLDYGTLLHTASTKALALQERNELALGLGISLDVALRHGQTGMAREFLDVPETAPHLRDFARSTRNEGATAGMRRTPVHLQRRREPMEPQAHGRRRQPPAPRRGSAGRGWPCPRARSVM